MLIICSVLKCMSLVERMARGMMTEDKFDYGCRLASVALFGLKVQEVRLLYVP